MLYLWILVLVPLVFCKNKTTKSTTEDPYFKLGVDYRPYRFAPFVQSDFRIFNNNPAEILINNFTHEIVLKYPKTFQHVNCYEDIFIPPFSYSDSYDYDYQIGKRKGKDKWQLSVEYNNTGYISDPVFCEIDREIYENVTITVDIEKQLISIERPWIFNESRLTFSPLRSMGEITTKGKWW